MSYLVIDGPFSVAVDQQSVNVVRIPPETIPKVAWWLVREYCVNWKNKTHFNSLFMVRLRTLHKSFTLIESYFCCGDCFYNIG